MTITRDTSLRDVCFVVCTTLGECGVTAILTGGSAAAVYAPEACQSGDADFVLQFSRSDPDAVSGLASLGYREERQTYHHTENPFTLDFLDPPLTVGRDQVSAWATLREGDAYLHILTPTDCVRDRLAAFYFWNDRSSLQAALAVAGTSAIDLGIIRDWSARERHLPRFEQFLQMLRR